MVIQQQPLELVQRRLENQARAHLADLPTPLELLPNLSEQLHIQLWIKRDDQTGLALGGNKARKLEFLLADALNQGADTVITTGGSQSNHARMTAAACRQLALDCYLVLDRGRHPHNGNLLLDELFGAHIELLESSELAAATACMEALAAELRAAGHRPYVVPRGGGVPAGAIGYVQAVVELSHQLNERRIKPDYLYLATGSGGTHAGVLAGATIVGLPFEIQGISVSRPRAAQEAHVWELANRTLEYLGLDACVARAAVHVDDGFIGGGYGQPTPEMWETLRMVARADGLLLDPVYTGKAMAGLLAHVRQQIIPKDAIVIFLHTGGTPALFAYAEELLATLR
jgi:D-cysteine desulfhydrase family pyridoxal phosphate-dependent enzyme